MYATSSKVKWYKFAYFRESTTMHPLALSSDFERGGGDAKNLSKLYEKAWD